MAISVLRLASALSLLVAVGLSLCACQAKREVPDPQSKEGAASVSAFYAGLAAFEVGDDMRADAKLAEVTRVAPGEAAAWANWGLLALRRGDLDQAAERLARARALAPSEAPLWVLSGQLESRRGRSAEAIAAFRKAVELAPANVRASYLLVQENERLGAAGSEDEVERLLSRLVAAAPDNIALLLDLAQIAARRARAQDFDAALANAARNASGWPPEARAQLADIQSLAGRGDLRAASIRVSRLRNALTRVPEYRASLAVIKAPAGADVEPIRKPYALAAAPSRAAQADTRLRFEALAPVDAADHRWAWVGALRLDDRKAPVLARADALELQVGKGAARLPFPGGSPGTPPGPESILQIDFSYDFRTDLVLAGAGGVRLFRQEEGDRFVDVTARTGLPGAIVDAAYTGAWAVDIEADGDLDIVLGRKIGEPVVLRNNGDGSFTSISAFTGVDGLSQFVWLDLDGDGVPDVALIDGSGRLRIFMNRRQGQFVERAAPSELADVRAIATERASARGGFDLLVVLRSGAIDRLSDAAAGWEVTTLASVPAAAVFLAGEVRLRVADLDNNGVADWLLARVTAGGAGAPSSYLWLGEPDGKMSLHDQRLRFGAVLDIADLNDNGRLDLLALTPGGQPVVAANRPALTYHWQTIRPRAAQAFGDQRINPFGVGGAVEIRAGTLTQRSPISGPVVHFGLGEQSRVDIVRVLWPNGVMQAEFDVDADASIAAEQRLKGSCPFMFAFNGKTMAFVKDTVPWGSAIGLRINNIGSASIAATEEWYKISGNDLVPRDGAYDVRITGELWEVYYYDFLSLTAVDHPPGTEVFVDERFVIPPVAPAITVVETPHALRSAHDDSGRDMTAVLRELDGSLVDGFARGQYQGVAKEHHIELDLGAEADVRGPLYLIAHGSIRPTDSSINVAMSQGEGWRPHGLALETPDADGNWKVVRKDLGFPAGRRKTILIDLDGVFAAGAARRVRLRTNLEIYWDKIEWARGRPDAAIRTSTLPVLAADLHYRGYSAIAAPPAGAPEIPDYNRLVASKQRWRDLAGSFTRYGDVRELLASADDRYVIMNAGDEMSFRFAETAPPQAGWKRDFVVKGDGWIKDGDFNSTFSRTVLPLPHHGQRDYSVAPGRLEDETAYRLHPEDWQNYHTRYIDAAPAVGALAGSSR